MCVYEIYLSCSLQVIISKLVCLVGYRSNRIRILGFFLYFNFLKMGSSDRLFNRQRTVHQILGGGLVADVVLWRRKNLTKGILLVTLAAWLVFEKSGYTILSLVSSVLLLLVAILFLWSKSAAILNRPAPPLPDLYLSEEAVNDVTAFVCGHINALLTISKDIALGKDTRMFSKVATYLLLISVIGSFTDFLTLGYTSLVIVLTIPALYEKYEDYIDRYVSMGGRKLRLLYMRFDVECLGRIRKVILEQKKLIRLLSPFSISLLLKTHVASAKDRVTKFC